MKDIRISVSFTDHPKTIKLIRKAGYEAVVCLIRLWLWAAQERPNGVFRNMDEEDIEIVAGWTGADGEFLSICEQIGWVDRGSNVLELHDWQKWQPWVCGAEDRSDRARLSRMAKTHPKLYAELKAKGVDAISAQKYVSLTAAQRNVNDMLTPAPSPLSKESSLLSGKKKKDTRIDDMALEVLAYLNKKSGKSFKVTGQIPARLRAGATVHECKLVIDFKATDSTFDEKYLDHTTPFREANFDRYLNQALSHSKIVQKGKPNEKQLVKEWPSKDENRWAKEGASNVQAN